MPEGTDDIGGMSEEEFLGDWQVSPEDAAELQREEKLHDANLAIAALFVRNLPYAVSFQMLEQMFDECAIELEKVNATPLDDLFPEHDDDRDDEEGEEGMFDDRVDDLFLYMELALQNREARDVPETGDLKAKIRCAAADLIHLCLSVTRLRMPHAQAEVIFEVSQRLLQSQQGRAMIKAVRINLYQEHEIRLSQKRTCAIQRAAQARAAKIFGQKLS